MVWGRAGLLSNSDLYHLVQLCWCQVDAEAQLPRVGWHGNGPKESGGKSAPCQPHQHYPMREVGVLLVSIFRNWEISSLLSLSAFCRVLSIAVCPHSMQNEVSGCKTNFPWGLLWDLGRKEVFWSVSYWRWAGIAKNIFVVKPSFSHPLVKGIGFMEALLFSSWRFQGGRFCSTLIGIYKNRDIPQIWRFPRQSSSFFPHFRDFLAC